MRRKHLDRATWHVMARGARRLLLFRDDADRAAFLKLLGESLRETGVSLHSFVLMDNHYHLLLSGGWEALGRCMLQLNRRFSRGNNAKYGLKGHAFEGPYLSFPQRSAFWIGRTARYIDFNPVRARRVRRPEQYRWSSCRTYVLGTASPVPLETRTVLDAFSGSRRAYQSFEPPASRGKPPREIAAADVWREHAAWLVHYAGDRRTELSGESPRTIAAAWAHQAGVPPRAIADALGYANGHSVSVIIDALRRRAAHEPALRKILSDPEIGFRS